MTTWDRCTRPLGRCREISAMAIGHGSYLMDLHGAIGVNHGAIGVKAFRYGPSLLADLNHGDHCRVLFKCDKASAQVVLLRHGALHRFVAATMTGLNLPVAFKVGSGQPAYLMGESGGPLWVLFNLTKAGDDADGAHRRLTRHFSSSDLRLRNFDS